MPLAHVKGEGGLPNLDNGSVPQQLIERRRGHIKKQFKMCILSFILFNWLKTTASPLTFWYYTTRSPDTPHGFFSHGSSLLCSVPCLDSAAILPKFSAPASIQFLGPELLFWT